MMRTEILLNVDGMDQMERQLEIYTILIMGIGGTMLDKLQEHILDGEFDLGRSLYKKENCEMLEHDILVIAYNTDNIATYFFILYMIFHREEAELHFIACSLLINPFVYIQGAYYLAYDHILKASILDPHNLKYKENLLFFYHIPEKILGINEAINIANQILKVCPTSSAAKSIINEKKNDIN